MTSHAYAHLDNSTVRIEVERETRLRVPLHHLGGLVCFGNALVSPALIHRLADEGKSLVLLDEHGRFKARMEGSVSGIILLRQAQYRLADQTASTLEFARAIVAGKLKNSRSVLMRGAREATDSGEAQTLTRIADNLAASLRAALALDLQEEFRSFLVDHLALTLINRGQIPASDFDEREGGAVMLNDSGRRTVLTAWQERKQEELTHPLLEQKLPMALLPLVQARFMARTLLGEMESYLSFQAR